MDDVRGRLELAAAGTPTHWPLSEPTPSPAPVRLACWHPPGQRRVAGGQGGCSEGEAGEQTGAAGAPETARPSRGVDIKRGAVPRTRRKYALCHGPGTITQRKKTPPSDPRQSNLCGRHCRCPVQGVKIPIWGGFPVRVQAPSDTPLLHIWAGGLSSATTSHLSGWYVRLRPSWAYIGLIYRIGVADCLYEVAECSDDDGDLVPAHPGLTGHGRISACAVTSLAWVSAIQGPITAGRHGQRRKFPSRVNLFRPWDATVRSWTAARATRRCFWPSPNATWALSVRFTNATLAGSRSGLPADATIATWWRTRSRTPSSPSGRNRRGSAARAISRRGCGGSRSADW